MRTVAELFVISTGHNYALSKLRRDERGLAFVARSARNNGVTARVARTDVGPSPAGSLTVALSGTVMETFLQPEPFYSGFHIAVLQPRRPMTESTKLWYAACIRAHAFRFNYGRQANRVLATLRLPPPPPFVRRHVVPDLERARCAGHALTRAPAVSPAAWSSFVLGDLFFMERGGSLTTGEAQSIPGDTAFVAAAQTENGVVARTGAAGPQFLGGVIAFVANGRNSAGLAFYQPNPFIASQDIVVLTPRFTMDAPSGLFIARVIALQRAHFNHGRKASSERLEKVTIRLPRQQQAPDVKSMRTLVRALPFSRLIEDPQPSALDQAKLALRGRRVVWCGREYSISVCHEGSRVWCELDRTVGAQTSQVSDVARRVMTVINRTGSDERLRVLDGALHRVFRGEQLRDVDVAPIE